jgi:hypothetical protein
VALTPAIRDFLVRLDELFEARGTPMSPDVTDVDTAAFVRLGEVELEIDDRIVLVRYRPEEIKFTSRDEALQFIEMLADDRVELEVHRGLLWTTRRSYRDGQPIPFRRTRMPWPSLHPRTERRRITLFAEQGPL